MAPAWINGDAAAAHLGVCWETLRARMAGYPDDVVVVNVGSLKRPAWRFR